MSQAKSGAGGSGGSRDKEALLKSYQKRLKDDIRAMIDNFQEILKSSKVPTADEEGQVRVTFSSSFTQCIYHLVITRN